MKVVAPPIYLVFSKVRAIAIVKIEDKITFEELYEAYILCLKNKKRKVGTYNFVNENLCVNLLDLMNKLNTYEYIPQPSNCYVITNPALREIYAAQFSDRIVQHFYMKEIEDIYQKPSKQVIIRLYQKAEKIKFTDDENLLAKTNSQIGSLKNYNCKRFIFNYAKTLPDEAKEKLSFNSNKFVLIH